MLDALLLFFERGVRSEHMASYCDIVRPNSVVLVVDDDPAVRNSLKFSLEIEGFIVRAYASGGELLSDPDLPDYGCVVVDQKMPGMTGLDLVATLRERHVALPAILITTNPSAAVRRRAAQAGVPVIEKPLLGDALSHGIHDALARDDRAQS